VCRAWPPGEVSGGGRRRTAGGRPGDTEAASGLGEVKIDEWLKPSKASAPVLGWIVVIPINGRKHPSSQVPPGRFTPNHAPARVQVPSNAPPDPATFLA